MTTRPSAAAVPSHGHQRRVALDEVRAQLLGPRPARLDHQRRFETLSYPLRHGRQRQPKIRAADIAKEDRRRQSVKNNLTIAPAAVTRTRAGREPEGLTGRRQGAGHAARERGPRPASPSGRAEGDPHTTAGFRPVPRAALSPRECGRSLQTPSPPTSRRRASRARRPRVTARSARRLPRRTRAQDPQPFRLKNFSARPGRAASAPALGCASTFFRSGADSDAKTFKRIFALLATAGARSPHFRPSPARRSRRCPPRRSARHLRHHERARRHRLRPRHRARHGRRPRRADRGRRRARRRAARRAQPRRGGTHRLPRRHRRQHQPRHPAPDARGHARRRGRGRLPRLPARAGLGHVAQLQPTARPPAMAASDSSVRRTEIEPRATPASAA